MQNEGMIKPLQDRQLPLHKKLDFIAVLAVVLRYCLDRYFLVFMQAEVNISVLTASDWLDDFDGVHVDFFAELTDILLAELTDILLASLLDDEVGDEFG